MVPKQLSAKVNVSGVNTGISAAVAETDPAEPVVIVLSTVFGKSEQFP